MEEDDEEDYEELETEEKFDIDDSSPEAAIAAAAASAEKQLSDAANPDDHSIGAQKAREVAEGDRRQLMATQALRLERERSLDRQGTPTPELAVDVAYESRRSELEDSGAREDIHSANGRLLSSKSKIPKERADLDLKTPTMANALYQPGSSGVVQRHKAKATTAEKARARARSVEPRGRRAFAVWGQDESDSNASDSDADA